MIAFKQPLLIRAAAGPPLGSGSARARLGGLTMAGSAGALARARGPGARMLSAGGLVADWDCCWVGGKRIEDLAEWRALIESGKLAEVEGACALAWAEPDGTLALARDALGERTLY